MYENCKELGIRKAKTDVVCANCDDNVPIIEPEIGFLDLIDDSLIDPYHQNILHDLTCKIKTEKRIDNILKKFSGVSFHNYNWKLKYGVVNSGQATAATNSSLKSGYAVTTIDKGRATDLSMARTLIHESIHGYLVYYFRNDNTSASKSYSDLVEGYLKLQTTLRPDEAWNQANHDEMVRSWIGEIASSLQSYGEMKGCEMKDEFYKSLAWGGLTSTNAFDALETARKDQINRIIISELKGGYDGEVAKGEKTCD
ncbi:hypothetical protein [uncultured Roseivirga sp.]|uniref:hypothetical protein n=1 Tax=uncultured Roseivirga sp. TaxID=543088 RepID=UPI000D7ACD8C|nr:hypothetical protein [uncultured Roseivirga sp.]PWL29913.1 MAG: hypothetical protein DCO95_08745 [Roseivirga sp. XM-24bin3]